MKLTDFFSGRIEGPVGISECHSTTNGHGAGCFINLDVVESAQVEFDPILDSAEANTVPMTSASSKERDIVFTTEEDLEKSMVALETCTRINVARA